MTALLHADDRGIHCPLGPFWIDPWKPVPCAVVTHAHADHARPGAAVYHAASTARPLMERRLPGEDIIYHDEGEPFRIGDATVSLHPAGHILGSVQVRVEPIGGGPVWVAAGDYKRADDPTCAPFELVRCDGFITEATFALPAYRWEPASDVADAMLDWWLANRQAGRIGVLFCYALGKAQRVLAELHRAVLRQGLAPADHIVRTHGATERLVEAYRECAIDMLPTAPVADDDPRADLVMAPPAAAGSPWMKRWGTRADTAFVSGWMRIRGVRRRRGYDRGFVLSDHADWPDLIRTIDDTGATTVLATHGNSDTLARFVRESRQIDARVLQTPFDADEPDA